MIFVAIFGILFSFAIIWIVIRLINNGTLSHLNQDFLGIEKNKPIEVLKERYVKGEITKKQFQGMKKELEK